MIGILDSGVGGLSVLREIRRQLPQSDLCYVGDNAFCPYGTKSTEVLQERVGEIVEFFLQKGCTTVVLACNSATIQAIAWCREKWPQLNFVGMEPGVKPAVAASRSGVIGVLATEASLTGKMFARLVEEHGGACKVLTQACPDFVTLVESGVTQGPALASAIRKYAQPLVAQGADVLVLGCSHYNFLTMAIASALPEITLIDTAPAVAKRVVEVEGADVLSDRAAGKIAFYTSGEAVLFQDHLSELLSLENAEVKDFGK